MLRNAASHGIQGVFYLFYGPRFWPDATVSYYPQLSLGRSRQKLQFEAKVYVRIELMRVVCVRVEPARAFPKGAATILLRGVCEH